MKRQLAAILHADVAGYSRLSGINEEQTHQMLSIGLELLTSTIEKYNGQKVNEAGDAILAEFYSVIDSVNCAAAFQLEMATHHSEQIEKERLNFRIGVNLGEVIHDRGEIFGDGVNVSARIQELAEPGGVYVTGAVYEQVNGKVDHSFDDMGHHKVKNIAQSIHVYRVHLFDTSQNEQKQPLFDFDPTKKDRSSLITGRCLCGDVRYEINQPMIGASYCHCRMCTRASGDGPVIASAAFSFDAVRFTRGKPKFYKSSLIAERGFCGNCGTSLTYRLLVPEPVGYLSMSVMSLDNPGDFAPTWHGGIESQMPWLDIKDDFPRTRIDESPELHRAWESVGVPDTRDWKEKD